MPRVPALWILHLTSASLALSQASQPTGLHTPLTQAIASGQPEAVSALLRSGVRRTVPYGGERFSRDAALKGRKLWAECESCHRLETSGDRNGPRINDLFSRSLANGKTSSFENIVELVTSGATGMPAFRGRMSRAEIDEVVSYLVASVEPAAGLPPYEFALISCNPKILGMLSPVPTLLSSQAKPKPVTMYAESMEQIVHLQQDLCLASLKFGKDPDLATQIADSQKSVTWLLGRWRQFAPTTWRPSNYDLVWQVRSGALERLTPGDARARTVVAGLRRDLELAVDDCRNSPQGMGTVRTVNVHTMRDGAPEAGWQVFFKFRIMEQFPDVPGQPFPNLSSPATWKLPPGNYLVYAQKKKQTTQPMPITVDRRTTDSTQWQIPLP